MLAKKYMVRLSEDERKELTVLGSVDIMVFDGLR